jgi:hypothetical protein
MIESQSDAESGSPQVVVGTVERVDGYTDTLPTASFPASIRDRKSALSLHDPAATGAVAKSMRAFSSILRLSAVHIAQDDGSARLRDINGGRHGCTRSIVKNDRRGAGGRAG